MRNRAFLFLCCGQIFVACAGGESDADTDVDQLAAFEDRLNVVTKLPYTPSSQIPTSGAVIYGGDVGLALPIGADQHYLGTLVLEVTFDPSTSPIDGTISGISGSTTVLDGELSIGRGTLDLAADPGTDFQIRAYVDGSLVGKDATHLVEGELAGGFYGPNADAVAGVVFGAVTTEGELEIFDGSFAAGRE